MPPFSVPAGSGDGLNRAAALPLLRGRRGGGHPDGASQAGVVWPLVSCHTGTHTSATSFTVTFCLRRPHGERLERLGRCLARRVEPVGLGLERLLEVGELLLERLRRVSWRAADVLPLLQDAPGAARGGRGAAERRGADRLAAEDRAEHRGADRDRRLEPCWRGLLAIRAPPPARRGGCVSSSAAIFGAYFSRSCSTASSRCSRPARACRRARKSPSISPGREQAAQARRTRQELERLRAVEPGGELLAPGRRSSSPSPRRAAARRRRAPAAGAASRSPAADAVLGRAVPVDRHGLRRQRASCSATGSARVDARLRVGEADARRRRAASAGRRARRPPARRARTGTKCCGTSGGSTGRPAARRRGRGRRRRRGGGARARGRATAAPAGAVARAACHQRLDLAARQRAAQVRHRPARLEDHRPVVVHVVHQEDAVAEAGERLLHPRRGRTRCPPRRPRPRARRARAPCRARSAAGR